MIFRFINPDQLESIKCDWRIFFCCWNFATSLQASLMCFSLFYTLVVDWRFLPRNFGLVVETYVGLLPFCECTWDGGSMLSRWGYLNTFWLGIWLYLYQVQSLEREIDGLKKMMELQQQTMVEMLKQMQLQSTSQGAKIGSDSANKAQFETMVSSRFAFAKIPMTKL